jgi:hypothetical protein
MVPVDIWGIMFGFSLLLLIWGLWTKQAWARIFGSILLMASGLVMLAYGGLQTGWLVTSTNPLTYEAYGLSTSEPWLFTFGTAIILIGFLTIFWGSTTTRKKDSFFNY